jgi:predicted PurR-regulated permease PerM
MSVGEGPPLPDDEGTHLRQDAEAKRQMAFELTPRQHRWLDALLILSTIAVGFIVLGYVGDLFFAFGDVLLVFFLAGLLAFVLRPPVAALERAASRIHRVVPVLIVYAVVIGVVILVVLLIADALARSTGEFIQSLPEIRQNLPALLAPWQERVDALGLAVNLLALADSFIDGLGAWATELAGPLQQIAVASLGVLGNVLFVVILSLYMSADRERMMSFLYRLVPPGYEAEARLLQDSLARSFGGFLRGQATLGLVYAAVAALTSAVLNLDFLPVTTATAGVLMAIPFFGPFIAWAPPVLVAAVLRPDVLLPAVLMMGAGWFVVMNILLPRVMGDAVGIHPIIVLGSVIIGIKIAGISGAIFGIPVAAVLSAFFFHFFTRASGRGSIASRAAQRLEVREGRKVRVPVEPDPGIDEDLEDAGQPPSPRPVKRASTRPAPAPSTGAEGDQ